MEDHLRRAGDYHNETALVPEVDSFTYTLNTAPGSAWDLLPIGGKLVETFTVTSYEKGGSLLPDLDGDIGNYTDTFTFTLTFVKTCFARGTRILTHGGEVAVEDLRPGDRVMTDNGRAHVVRQVMSRRYAGWQVDMDPALRPIEFAPGAIGNKGQLVVSQRHRMLVSGPDVEMNHGVRRALVAARYLVNGRTIRIVEDVDSIEYFHIVLDQHAIIMANGVPTESFYLGAQVRDAADARMRDELIRIFGADAMDGLGAEQMQPAAPVMHGVEARFLAMTVLNRSRCLH